MFLPRGPWHFVLIGDKCAPRMLSSWVACELDLHRQEKVRVSTAVGVGSCRQLEQHSTKQHNVSPLFSNPLISGLHLLVCLQCAQKMQLHRDWFVSVWYKKVSILSTCKSWVFSPSPLDSQLPLHFQFNLSVSLCLSVSSDFRKSILSVPDRRDDGFLAAYHAFDRTTKRSKHVCTGSCAHHS